MLLLAVDHNLRFKLCFGSISPKKSQENPKMDVHYDRYLYAFGRFTRRDNLCYANAALQCVLSWNSFLRILEGSEHVDVCLCESEIAECVMNVVVVDAITYVYRAGLGRGSACAADTSILCRCLRT